jgi:excisionase family DNA binding protein
VDDLLTTKQLQELLQIDRITIYRMLNDGRLRGFKVGGQWRFSRREIEHWLEEQRSDSEDAQEPHLAEDDLSTSSQSLPIACIQAVQAIYAEALDVAAVTVDLDGSPMTDVSNSCDYCGLILSTTEGRRRCVTSWKRVAGGQVAACHAGLLCAGAPVEVRGQPVASVASCQFVAPPSEGPAQGWQANIPALAAQLGLDEGELRAAADSVRPVSMEERSRIVRLLSRAAATFGEIGEERAMFVERLHRIAEMTNL